MAPPRISACWCFFRDRVARFVCLYKFLYMLVKANHGTYLIRSNLHVLLTGSKPFLMVLPCFALWSMCFLGLRPYCGSDQKAFAINAKGPAEPLGWVGYKGRVYMIYAILSLELTWKWKTRL